MINKLSKKSKNALYSPYPSLLKYTKDFFPNNLKSIAVINVYGVIEIIKHFESLILFEEATSEM